MTDHTMRFGARPAAIVHHGLRTGPTFNTDRAWALLLFVTALMLGGTTVMFVQGSIDLTSRTRAMDLCIVRAQNAEVAQDPGVALRWMVEARKAKITGVCRDSDVVLRQLM